LARSFPYIAGPDDKDRRAIANWWTDGLVPLAIERGLLASPADRFQPMPLRPRPHTLDHRLRGRLVGRQLLDLARELSEGEHTVHRGLLQSGVDLEVLEWSRK